jgi:hypothetical protein
MKTEYILERTVRYVAVYPDGRRLEVTREDALQLGERWEREEGCVLETEVKQRHVLALGQVRLIP